MVVHLMPYSEAVLPTRLWGTYQTSTLNLDIMTYNAISPRLAIKIDVSGFEMVDRYLLDKDNTACCRPTGLFVHLVL